MTLTIEWASPLHEVHYERCSFDIDLLCPRCHNAMKLKSSITSSRSLQPLLATLGEPTDVQGKAPARGPLYFASQVLRQRFDEHATRVGMLD